MGDAASWLSSAALHAIGVVALSLVILPQTREPLREMFGIGDDDIRVDLAEDAPDVDVGVVNGQGGPLELPGAPAEALGAANGSPEARVFIPTAVGSSLHSTSAASGSGSGAAGEFTLDAAPAAAATSGSGGLESVANPLAPRGGGLGGRRVAGRLGEALKGGGSQKSEAAVEAGLLWLANHQWPDGGWRFDLDKCLQCAGYCRDSGMNTSTTAATGLALLSFLGGGYTHLQGKYQETVAKGLYYLQNHQTITTLGGDLRDHGSFAERAKDGPDLPAVVAVMTSRRDSMYSHGIASLAITEAYAMTRDKALRQPAEEAVKFIVKAQYTDGGWRYSPASESPGPGDMTVSGWQLATLKSALLAGIEVPYEVWIRARDFIDGLADDGGSTYVYVRGQRGTRATTAIGLLARMIDGWPRDHRPLQKGAALLADEAPDRNNIYFDFYASQVLHHLGGSGWQRWNPRMRDYLTKTQATEGHETGSWYFAEEHSTQGGRLYTTSLAVMTLEVYYRYMPIYKEAFVDRAP